MRSAKEYKAIREEIYRFIGAYITKHVYAPSNREIAEAVGISGTTVHRHLIGILETDAEPGTQRAIRIRNTQVVKRRKKSE
jgi:SOS-response transcriptional repressor LexA